MRIVPVIDLLNGFVVHAYRGERSTYKPIKSKLLKSKDPVDFVKLFKDFGFLEIYIADLNSIMGKGNNYKIIREITKGFEVKVFLDSGVDKLKKAKEALNLGIDRIVIGSETLKSLLDFEEILNYTEKVIFSLDIFENRVLSHSELKGLSIREALKLLNPLNFQDIMILYLSKVGTKSGLDLKEIKEIRNLTKKRIFIGGGIKSFEELLELKNIGIERALIATLLHEGKILKEDLSKLYERRDLYPFS
ncbi:MAG: HisA/HisF-related TIM barrel protein [Nitrososphaerales archaeon]